MKLQERKCPNCGGTDIAEKDGTCVCMNCRTFFDDANEIKITKNTTTTIRDEAALKKLEYEKAKEKRDRIVALVVMAVLALALVLMWKAVT